MGNWSRARGHTGDMLGLLMLAAGGLLSSHGVVIAELLLTVWAPCRAFSEACSPTAEAQGVAVTLFSVTL